MSFIFNDSNPVQMEVSVPTVKTYKYVDIISFEYSLRNRFMNIYVCYGNEFYDHTYSDGTVTKFVKPEKEELVEFTGSNFDTLVNGIPGVSEGASGLIDVVTEQLYQILVSVGKASPDSIVTSDYDGYATSAIN